MSSLNLKVGVYFKQLHDGFAATVIVAGIFTMNEAVGTIFNNMFTCIMKHASNSTIDITLEDVRDNVGTCASTSDTAAESNIVRNTLLDKCGNADGPLPKETCNQLYRTLVTTTPEDAFD